MGNYMINTGNTLAEPKLTDYENMRSNFKMSGRNTLRFESYLDTAKMNTDKQTYTADKPARREKQSNDKSTRAGEAAKKQRDIKDSRKPLAHEARDTGEPVQSKPAEAETTVSTEKPDSKEQLDKEKLVKNVAELLDITCEDVLEILNALNLSISDLSDNSKLLEFVSEVFSVTDISGLLGIPNIKDVIVSLQEMLEGAAAQTTSLATESMPDLSGMIDEADANAATDDSMVNTAAEETLAYSAQDLTGDEQMSVLTDQVSADDAVANNSTRQAIGTNAPEATSVSDETQDEIINDDTQVVITDGELPETELSSSGNGTNDKRNGDMQNHFNDTDLVDPRNTQNNVGFNFNTNQAIQDIKVNVRPEVRASGIDTQDIINQVVDRIKVEVRANVSEVKMTLKPESLGEVSLKLAIENGIITAQFTAENQRVKALIESNFDQLKDALQEQGLDVAELYVSVGQGQDQAQEKRDMYVRSRQMNAGRIRRIMGEAGIGDEPEAEPVTVDADSLMDIMA